MAKLTYLPIITLLFSTVLNAGEIGICYSEDAIKDVHKRLKCSLSDNQNSQIPSFASLKQMTEQGWTLIDMNTVSTQQEGDTHYQATYFYFKK